MSKSNFRPRALPVDKHLPIYFDEEIQTEHADCSLINRTVPQMPTGMEKEEEAEHHLQKAIQNTGEVIPTPDVYEIPDLETEYYSKLYPENYKLPRQLIYMQPFSMEADIPDYDMDSEDEVWVNSQASKLELTPDKFEEMMDRLEKGSGQTVVTLSEAKALIKEDDDLIIAVYDYWLNKRLTNQHRKHPLIPQVKTEARAGVSNHYPYIAFRRRTEKMQTRKNRKNDESSYEKMLKLKRDLTRAVTLLEMVKRREKSKRELLHLTIEVFEKRYQAGDFSGQIVNEALSSRPVRPAFTQLFQPNQLNWMKDPNLVASLSRKEKRHYKKKRHKSSNKIHTPSSTTHSALGYEEYVSSEEELGAPASVSDEEEEDEGEFQFRRKRICDYHSPIEGNWPWCSKEEGGKGNKKFRFCPTSISVPRANGKRSYRYAGYCRRRIGRGGRVIIDRMRHPVGDEYWKSMEKGILPGTSSTIEESETTDTTKNINNNNFEELSSLVSRLTTNQPQPSTSFAIATTSSFPFPTNSISFNSSTQTHTTTTDIPSTTSDVISNSLLEPTSSLPPEEEYEDEYSTTSPYDLIHFRPKTPELQVVNRLQQEEEEELELSNYLIQRRLASISPIHAEFGNFISAVITRGERPLVFDVATLLTDPLPQPGHESLNESEPTTTLLDEQSSDLGNAQYFIDSTINSTFSDDWFTIMEMGDDVLNSPSAYEILEPPSEEIIEEEVEDEVQEIMDGVEDQDHQEQQQQQPSEVEEMDTSTSPPDDEAKNGVDDVEQKHTEEVVVIKEEPSTTCVQQTTTEQQQQQPPPLTSSSTTQDEVIVMDSNSNQQSDSSSSSPTPAVSSGNVIVVLNDVKDKNSEVSSNFNNNNERRTSVDDKENEKSSVIIPIIENGECGSGVSSEECIIACN